MAQAVSGADKPEHELFIAVVNEEGNIEVSAAVHGVIEVVETKDGRLFPGILIVMKLTT